MERVWLSSTYYLDPKLAGANASVERMFLRLVAYSGSAELRGKLPPFPHRFVGILRGECAVKELVRRGILQELDDGGYYLAGWENWQSQGDDLLERRRKDRERKRRKRAEEGAPVRGQSAEFRPLEEKRREERDIGTDIPSPSVPDAGERVGAANPYDDGRARRRLPALSATASRAVEVVVSAPARDVARGYAGWAGGGIDSRTQAEIAHEVDPLLADGIDPRQIADGIKAWHSSNSFSPTQIRRFVAKAARPPTAQQPTKATLRAVDTLTVAEQIIAAMNQETA